MKKDNYIGFDYTILPNGLETTTIVNPPEEISKLVVDDFERGVEKQGNEIHANEKENMVKNVFSVRAVIDKLKRINIFVVFK